MDHKPWIEKYRPTKFNEIVLEKTNKILLKNIFYWKDAPLWNKKNIHKETKNWFKYLK